MNRTDFFKQIGIFAAGAATAIATKLSVTPKDELKVTNNVTLRAPTGEVYGFVVVQKTSDSDYNGSEFHSTLNNLDTSSNEEVRNLNV